MLNPIVRHDGKVVGYYDKDKGMAYFTKTREHLMRKYRGFGMSDYIINLLRKEGIDYIRFKYLGVKTHYYFCNLKLFLETNIKEIDRTNGIMDIQKFVPIAQMMEVGQDVCMSNEKQEWDNDSREREKMVHKLDGFISSKGRTV